MDIYIVNDCEDASGVYFTSLRKAAKFIWDNGNRNGCVITHEFSCKSYDELYRKLLNAELSTYKYVDYDSEEIGEFGAFQFEICKAMKG